MQGVDFLSIADHDLSGFQIYLTLKYGSRTSAWLSNAQSCPPLRWIGPKAEDLQKIVEIGADIWLEDQLQLHKAWTVEEQAQQRDQWIVEKRESVEKTLRTRMGATFKKPDRSMMTAWASSGIFKREPGLQQACEAIKSKGHGVSTPKFPFLHMR
jgi:DNA topoisomerase VI subunit A